MVCFVFDLFNAKRTEKGPLHESVTNSPGQRIAQSTIIMIIHFQLFIVFLDTWYLVWGKRATFEWSDVKHRPWLKWIEQSMYNYEKRLHRRSLSVGYYSIAAFVGRPMPLQIQHNTKIFLNSLLLWQLYHIYSLRCHARAFLSILCKPLIEHAVGNHFGSISPWTRNKN